MEELSERREEKVEMECDTLEASPESLSRTEKSVPDTDTLEQATQTAGVNTSLDKNQSPSVIVENPSPSRTKVKRKARSTRRKLNAMINNTSLHFSDSDSEGELTAIKSHVRVSSHPSDAQQGPVISVIPDDVGAENGLDKISNLLSPDVETSRRNSFADNLTDVDEIYASETEAEQKEIQTLKVAESPCQGDTDLEDFEGEDEVQAMIYVEPRSDIFCDYSGETIMTKEGDGPFSVEIRNKMYREEIPQNKLCSTTPDIVVVTNTDTDEEDMDVSDEEDLQEACYSQKEILEDLDVLTASQIIMRNINKMDNMLTVKDISEDGASDCHTDVEDVDQIE